jgi:hypothetical protein
VYQYTGPTSWDGTHPYITNPKIDEIGYNIARTGTVTDASNNPLGWTDPIQGNNKVGTFPEFTHDYGPSTSNNDRYSTVIMKLSGSSPFPLLSATDEYAVALHLAFDGAYTGPITDPNSRLLVGNDITLRGGSTFLAGRVAQIPEFPSVVLPVAAIFGLILISQRKRK